MAWRRLEPPLVVSVFLGEAWHETTACAVDEETREIRAHWPPHQATRHVVLDASRYRLRPPLAETTAPR